MSHWSGTPSPSCSPWQGLKTPKQLSQSSPTLSASRSSCAGLKTDGQLSHRSAMPSPSGSGTEGGDVAQVFPISMSNEWGAAPRPLLSVAVKTTISPPTFDRLGVHWHSPIVVRLGGPYVHCIPAGRLASPSSTMSLGSGSVAWRSKQRKSPTSTDRIVPEAGVGGT